MAPAYLKVFSVELDGDVLIVTPQGDAEAFRYQDFHVETNSLLDLVNRQQPRRLVMDFSAVTLVGSLMFATLIKLARAFDHAQKGACFCGASEPMQQALQTMRLTSRWQHFETRDEALQWALS